MDKQEVWFCGVRWRGKNISVGRARRNCHTSDEIDVRRVANIRLKQLEPIKKETVANGEQAILTVSTFGLRLQ